MTDETRSLVTPATILGVALVVASLAFAGGIWFALDRSAARLEAALDDHAAALRDAGERIGPPLRTSVEDLAAAVRDAGGQIGPPVRESLEDLSASVRQHAGATRDAGERIAAPTVTLTDPIAVREPLTVRGPANDGALPVNARIGGGSGESEDDQSRPASERSAGPSRDDGGDDGGDGDSGGQ